MKTKEGLHLGLNTAQFELLMGIHSGKNLTEISKKRGVSRQSIYKTLSTMIRKGFVSKTDYGTYEITKKGIEGLHSLVGFRYKLRQHNIGIKISILESPKNWNLKRNELRQIPYFNRTIKLKNNEQELFNFGKMQIRTTTKSIIIKMPTIYAKDWDDAVVQDMQILEDTIPKIEHIFKVKLVKDYKANMKIISQEYARIQDSLAKLYRSEGNRIYLTGDDGKIWLITDLSFSTDELELIHPNRATDDLDVISPFMNDLRKNPTTLSEIRQETVGVLETAKAIVQNEVKHQRVLDEMFLLYKKLNKRLDDLEKNNQL